MHVQESAWDDVKHQFDAACLQSAREARVQLVSEFNLLLRRFRQYETETEWVRLILDGARPFARQLALFSLENQVLHLRGQVNLALADGLSFRLDGAAAFQSACATKDPVTALRNPAEVTDALSVPAATERAHLLPIANGQRVAAILFVSGSEDSDLNALELVTGLASSILERQAHTNQFAQIATAPLLQEKAGPAAASQLVELPAWAQLGEQERLLHIRAQRFSRVTVAEMQLARPDACQAGREQGDLYVFLAKEIDRSREIYRRQFMTIPSMVDYLHLELVQSTAEGDESRLGADYPGQMV